MGPVEELAQKQGFIRHLWFYTFAKAGCAIYTVPGIGWLGRFLIYVGRLERLTR